jgi:hypothetical protein
MIARTQARRAVPLQKRDDGYGSFVRAGLAITEGFSSDKQQLGRKHLADRVPMAVN